MLEKLKQIPDKSFKGQFVGVWEFDNKIWSDTFRWNDRGYLECFNNENNDFETGTRPCRNAEITWFIIKGDA